MKKILSKLLIVFTIIFAFACNNVFAQIRSDGDIYAAINKLDQIQQKDFTSFFNKSELIGNRLSSFTMISEQYKTSAKAASDRLKNIIDRERVINESSDLSQSDKESQIRNLYNEADSILFDMDSRTINYIYSVGSFMPTITYQRYSKTFTNYYNSLRLTGQQLAIQKK